MADYIFTLESRLTPEQGQAVKLVQQAARKHGVNLYLTGGAIRDILTGFAIRDLDFTVQGNPYKLLKDLVSHGAKPNGGDEASGSLRLILPGAIRAEIVMSHAENYPKPGKPPVITPANITDDLRRRDFTVNAMALSLNIGSLGLLLDPANGSADVEAQKLRILHNYSFYEDPSRLIRIVRFGARFRGWEMEERTAARYAAAKENNYIDFLRKESISYELEQLVCEEDPVAVVKALEHEGWLKLLHARLSHSKIDSAGLQALGRMRMQMWGCGVSAEGAPAALRFLIHKMNSNDVREIEKLIANPALLAAYRSLDADSKALAKLLSSKDAAKPSQAWRILTEANPEVLLYLALTGKQAAVSQKIGDFLGKWRREMEKLPYAEMAELRITPQLPDYAQLTHQLFLQLIDGKLKNREELVAFLEPYSPPLPPPPPPTVRRRSGKVVAKKAGKAEAPKPSVAAVEAPAAEPKAAEPKAPAPKAAKAEKKPAEARATSQPHAAKAEAKAATPSKPSKAAAKLLAKAPRPEVKAGKAAPKAPAKTSDKVAAKASPKVGGKGQSSLAKSSPTKSPKAVSPVRQAAPARKSAPAPVAKKAKPVVVVKSKAASPARAQSKPVVGAKSGAKAVVRTGAKPSGAKAKSALKTPIKAVKAVTKAVKAAVARPAPKSAKAAAKPSPKGKGRR